MNAPSGTDPVVATTHGRVRGRWRDVEGRPTPGPGPRFTQSAAFKGIPFAAPPVGERAFEAPYPPQAWTGTRDATRHGATPQRRTLSELTSIPEPVVDGDDTLVVDVFTPAPGGATATGEAVAPLPVLVWVHGGAFTGGSPASPWYDGLAFNRDGVVTVSVSYRLGVVGFGDVDDAIPNRAVLDWVAALEWVRDNVAAFGGDPRRVTLAGHSAGGGAVQTLLTVPRAAGLFHAAILDSAALGSGEPAESRAVVSAVAERLGVEPTAAALAAVPETDLLDAQSAVTELSALAPPEPGEVSTEQVLDGLREAMDSRLGLAPVVDGDIVPAPVADALRDGASRDVRLLLGTTAGEFDRTLDDIAPLVDPIPAERLLAAVGVPRALARLYAARSEVRGLPTSRVGGHLVTDVLFRIPAAQTAESHARGGGRQTWVYDFRWRSRSTQVGGVAQHCLDVPFAFDALGRGDRAVPETGVPAGRLTYLAGATPPQALADLVHGAWVAFVRDGDPGWAPYATDARTPPRARRQVRVWDAVTRTVSDGYRFERVAGAALRLAARRGQQRP